MVKLLLKKKSDNTRVQEEIKPDTKVTATLTLTQASAPTLDIKINDSNVASKNVDNKNNGTDDVPLKKTSSSYHTGDPVDMKNIKDQAGSEDSHFVDLITQVQSKRTEIAESKKRKTIIISFTVFILIAIAIVIVTVMLTVK